MQRSGQSTHRFHTTYQDLKLLRSANRSWRYALPIVLTALTLCASMAAPAQNSASAAAPVHLTIDTGDIVSPVSPTLYGLMTEEINHAFDGGLYAELLQNRTFRDSWQDIDHWDLVRLGHSSATMQPDKTTGPSKALPYSLKLTATTASPGSEAGIASSGYWGVPLKAHTTYRGSFYAKVSDEAVGPVTAKLIDDRTGTLLASATIPISVGDWSRHEYTLTTGSIVPSATNHLQLTIAHPGTVWLQLVSLMPPTFNNRPNGNRIDLMERMAALHPHFLRLPGGNYLEGDRPEDWYNFKQTIGPLVDRPGHQAPWTYWSTDGMGMLEFLDWCEDLKMEPLLAVYAGYALNGSHIAPGKDLDPYVQSALDEVEYVSGDVTTKWGAQRAKDGHPAPFPLHYIEIGNEDNFDKSGSYDARFAQFARALRKQYPQYKLIATTPVKETATDEQPDVIDDHYYKPSNDMLDFTHHYDNAPRTGPKVFVGEWATISGTPTPNFAGALADSAWMTSMERNSDLIIMASYAPLLVNVNPQASQWATNLIGYDALRSYGSPSYYAQALFASHIGDGTPRTTVTGAGDRFFDSATIGSTDHVLHLKLVNASNRAQPLDLDLHGVAGAHEATLYSLHAASYEATNSLSNPELIKPVESKVRVTGSTLRHTVPALTIEVLDIPLK
jgi:alpha-N-arabinofuranosidase